MKIFESWRQTLRYLRQSWQQVFVTHLAYTALGFILFTTPARILFLCAARLVARVLLLTLPLLEIARAIALFLITEFDISYYLTKKPPEFLTAVILIGTVLIFMVVLLTGKLRSIGSCMGRESL
ncbi:MAG: hypothetical protein BMS9Abin25_0451 [Gammaproteobacteria bacterium]|nr:MAG: hypothetical protein BMS9Abin25_0451 [Gammaproteobacteria bacterium]